MSYVQPMLSWFGIDQQKAELEKDEPLYEGEQEGEKRHGVGTLTEPNGNVYEGQWQYDNRHGFGTQNYGTGEKYQGQWMNDYQEGIGTLTWPGEFGDTFEGNWSDGARMKGTYVFDKQSRKFVGVWKDDAPFDAGVLELTEGTYHGEVLAKPMATGLTFRRYNFVRNGRGQMNLESGRFYGTWKNDKREGYGVLISSDMQYYGNWSNGMKSGQGILIYSDGTHYEGEFHSDKKSGKGILSFPNGDIIEGTWKSDNIEGAKFFKGSYQNVPKPLKALTLTHLAAPSKQEERDLYLSSKKWDGLLTDIIRITQETTDRDILRMISSASTTPINTAIDQFADVFLWNYSTRYSPDSPSGNSNSSKSSSLNSVNRETDVKTILAKAVDDVNSFVEGMVRILESHRVSPNRNPNFTKKIRRKIQRKATIKVYWCLFPLYLAAHRKEDSLLAAKLAVLQHVTPELIGVDPKFCIENRDGAQIQTESLERKPVERKESKLLLKSVRKIRRKDSKLTSEHDDDKGKENPSTTELATNSGDNNGENRIASDVQEKKGDVIVTDISGTSEKSGADEEDEEEDDGGQEDDNIAEDEIAKNEGTDPNTGSNGNLPEKSNNSKPGNQYYNPEDNSPYFPVSRLIKHLTMLKSPTGKLRSLMKASKSILSCVDNYYKNVQKGLGPTNIFMGAEDKFPVLIYAIIKSNAPSMWSQHHYLEDFVNNKVCSDPESLYRAQEFHSVLKYISALDPLVKDESNVLIPLHMLQQRIQWTLQAAIDKVPLKQRAKAVRVIVSVLQKIGDHHLKRNSLHFIISSAPTSIATTLTTAAITTTTPAATTSTTSSTTANISEEIHEDEPLVLLGDEYKQLHLYFSFFHAVFKKAGILLASDGNNSNSNGGESSTEIQPKASLSFLVKYPHHIYSQLAEQLNEFTDETMLKHFGCDIWTS